MTETRKTLRDRLEGSAERLFALTAALVQTPSPNPPGDTDAIAGIIRDWLAGIDGIEVSTHVAQPPITNIVARLHGAGPGRRLVFNGHLDTYPVGDPSGWSDDPLSGKITDGKLFGRGVSDMKGGIACSMIAMALLSECRDAWSGEVVLTLAGDEETMGVLGTQHLLETVPEAAGDAMISGDAGSPRVLRFGEKGMIWLDLRAKGKPSHGAHVHLGRNAIEALMEALDRLRALAAFERAPVPEVASAIDSAAPVSEPMSGAGETDVLGRVTVNIGTIEGGRAHNLVADAAHARIDIRVPAGVTVAALEARIAEMLTPLEDVSYDVLRRYEPTWTDPEHEIVRLCADVGEEILGTRPVANMRVGASDSRLYRLAGVPSVVCGLTPFNMGGANEHVLLDELEAVCAIHTLAAFDYLSEG